MKQGGRPRRSEEQPDSKFGEALKAHLRRVKDFTQVELSRETLIPEKTLSEMVKGKREKGRELRRDLRAIIKALYEKKALSTLEEANQLIRTIPATSPLDPRDSDWYGIASRVPLITTRSTSSSLYSVTGQRREASI